MLAALLATAVAAAPTLAVAPFATAEPALEPVGRGFADTLITDLAGVSEVQVVERAKLKLALDELKLWRTPLVDPATVAKVGQRLAADYLLTGELSLKGDALAVTARVVAVKTSRVLAARTVEGTRAQIFALEKDVAELLVEALALKLSVTERSRLRKARGKSYDEFLEFTKGLAALDSGDAAAAQQHFDAAKGDPTRRAYAFAVTRAKHAGAPLTAEEDAEFHAILAAVDPKSKEAGDALSALLNVTLGAPDARNVADQLELCEWIFSRDLTLMDGTTGTRSIEAQILTTALAPFESDPELGPTVATAYEYLLHKYPGDALAAESARRHLQVGRSQWRSGVSEADRGRARALLQAIDALVQRRWGAR